MRMLVHPYLSPHGLTKRMFVFSARDLTQILVYDSQTLYHCTTSSVSFYICILRQDH